MLYHSMYEIPWTVENLIDKNFAATTAVGQLWLELSRALADNLVKTFFFCLETVNQLIF